MLPPITPSSLYSSLIVCELLFNYRPSVIALVYSSPNSPPPDNISPVYTLETIISHRSDCVVLGGFNCPKVNWVSNTAPPKAVDSQLLNFCSDSFFRQCVFTPTRFRVNQQPSLFGLIFAQFPHLIFPISIHPPLGTSDHVPIWWAYISVLWIHVMPPTSVSSNSSAGLGEFFELNTFNMCGN